MIKWCNDNNFFLATHFHNSCSVVYFSLISSSYIKRNITSVNKRDLNNYFQCAPKCLFTVFFLRKTNEMKVCLSVLGAAKTERGNNTCCKSFCSAMFGPCAKWTALMNQLENNFQLWGCWKFSFWPNHRQGITHTINSWRIAIGDLEKKAFFQVYPTS